MTTSQDESYVIASIQVCGIAARIKPCNKCNFRESDISAEEQRAPAIDHSHDEKDERAAC